MESILGTIYLLTVTGNDGPRFLVGQTRNKLHRRISTYSSSLIAGTNYNARLTACYNKYGWDAFAFTVLEQCPIEKLNERERFYIIQLNTFNTPNGLNLTNGGEAGKVFSDETIKKMCETRKGKRASEKTKEKMRAARKGRKPSLGMIHSEECRQRLAKNHGGKEFTLIHNDGRTITDINKSKVANIIKMSRRQLRRILDGNIISFNGWTLLKYDKNST